MVEDEKTENRPTIYEIKIQGHLDAIWSEWFYGMTITHGGASATTLCGPLPDQTVLHSVLDRMRDMNLQLISVNPIKSDGLNINYEDKGESHEG